MREDILFKYSPQNERECLDIFLGYYNHTTLRNYAMTAKPDDIDHTHSAPDFECTDQATGDKILVEVTEWHLQPLTEKHAWAEKKIVERVRTNLTTPLPGQFILWFGKQPWPQKQPQRRILVDQLIQQIVAKASSIPLDTSEHLAIPDSFFVLQKISDAGSKLLYRLAFDFFSPQQDHRALVLSNLQNLVKETSQKFERRGPDVSATFLLLDIRFEQDRLLEIHELREALGKIDASLYLHVDHIFSVSLLDDVQQLCACSL